MKNIKKIRIRNDIDEVLGTLSLIFGIIAQISSVAMGWPGYGAYGFGIPAIILGILTIIWGNKKWKLVGIAGTALALSGIINLTLYILSH